MTVAGTGYALIAVGPAVSLFFSCIISKPFLILTLLASTLSWLITLILIAALTRILLPTGSSWLYAPIVVVAVAFQEATRLLFWYQYGKLENVLNQLAVKISRPRIHAVDKVEISLAFGLGHGFAHSLFFCVSLLTPAFGPATYYVDACPQMPFFLVASLTALGFLLIHTFSMIIAFSGHAEEKRAQQVFVPCMHLTAALLTLVNLAPRGCIFGVTLTLLCAIITLITCWKIIWHRTGTDALHSSDRHRPPQFNTGFD